MTPDTLISQTFSEVMANAAQALTEAAKQYGPDAVELGMVVYRISAIQNLAFGFLALIAAIVLVIPSWRLYKMGVKLRKENDDMWTDPEAGPWIVSALLTCTSLGFLLGAVNLLVNIYTWAAVLGYPQILITYKALVAAGLMQ